MSEITQQMWTVEDGTHGAQIKKNEGIGQSDGIVLCKGSNMIETDRIRGRSLAGSAVGAARTSAASTTRTVAVGAICDTLGVAVGAICGMLVVAVSAICGTLGQGERGSCDWTSRRALAWRYKEL